MQIATLQYITSISIQKEEDRDILFYLIEKLSMNEETNFEGQVVLCQSDIGLWKTTLMFV